MLFISHLFRGRSGNLIGPDFSNPIYKTVHLEPAATVKYAIPGNMSNMLGFAERYAEDSPTTIRIDLEGDLPCEEWHWRKSCDLDGGMWDYKMKGEAKLNLRIELLPIQSATEADDYIKSLYDQFLNGPDGTNTAVRGRNEGATDEDLGHWIRPIPSNFKWQIVGNERMLTWADGGTDKGKTTEYYAFVIAEDMLLNFAFTYSISSSSAKERELAKERLPQDIESFMRMVEVRR